MLVQIFFDYLLETYFSVGCNGDFNDRERYKPLLNIGRTIKSTFPYVDTPFYNVMHQQNAITHSQK